MTDQLSAVEKLTGMREREITALPAIERHFKNRPDLRARMLGISHSRITDILDTVRDPLEALGWTLTEDIPADPLGIFPTMFLGFLEWHPPQPMDLFAVVYTGAKDDPDVRNTTVTYMQQLEAAMLGPGSRLARGEGGFRVHENDTDYYAFSLNAWDCGA